MTTRNKLGMPMARGLAALLVTTSVLTIRPASSAPGDIFSMPAPVIGSDPAKASDLKDGDASVSTQTGALTFSYPIAVPPGRNGMAPQLALAYSSQSSIYGGVASGWSLSIPLITEDPSSGRLQTRSPAIEANQQAQSLDYRADDRFVSSLAGGQNLIAVSEPWGVAPGVYSAYRAQHDSSFSRYERMQTNQPFRWRVRTTSGVVMRFGDSATAGQGTYGCAGTDQNMISDFYAPLTHVTDAFGNEVRYDYEQVETGECRIKEIVWGQNPNAGINGPFAKLAFTWASGSSCTTLPPIKTGSHHDFRTGRLIINGASTLTKMTATAFPVGTPQSPEHTREITLAYNDGGGTPPRPNSLSCTQGRAALRELAEIKERAWGPNAPLVETPAVKFTYQPASARTAGATVTTTDSPGWQHPEDRWNNLGWGYRREDDRWPTVEAMMLDINGDGLLDRVRNPSSDVTTTIANCTAAWEENPGPGGATWPNGNVITLPRLKWRGTQTEAAQSAAGGASAYRPATGGGTRAAYESCALNGQVTAYKNSVETIGWCHTSSSEPAIACTPGSFTCPGGTRCPLDSAGPWGTNYRTYLAYRWLDMDSDGLVDLVAAVHGDSDAYDIERGTFLGTTASQPGTVYQNGEPSMFGIPGAGQWPSCSGQLVDMCIDPGVMSDMHNCPPESPLCVNWNLIGSTTSSPQKPCFSVLARAVGDGGGGSYTPTRTPYARCGGRYPWLIYKNNGNGSFAATPVIRYQPIPLESDTGDSAMSGPSVTAQHHGVMDFDGDGILDAVAHGKVWAGGNPDAIMVWLGDGNGGFGPQRHLFPTRPRGPSEDQNALSGTGTVGASIVESKLGLLDINADGLPDHWYTDSFGVDNVAFHDGARQRLVWSANGRIGERNLPFKPGNDARFPLLTPPFGMVETGTSVARNRTVDVDGDGRVDIVDLSGPTPQVYWNAGGQFLSAQPYPHASGVLREGLFRRVEASYDNGATEPYTWELKSDLLDLDGDGNPEDITIDGSGISTTATTTPQRLLVQIDNGRGATSTIAYAHMHDTTTVVQRPDLFWPDGRPKATPRTQWVVKNVTTSGSFGVQPSTVSYHYQHPRHGADENGKYGFRGFETVTTTANSGAKSVETFAFDVDKTGRKVKTATFPAETPSHPVSVTRSTWESRSLFLGSVKTFHATLTENFVCANGQTEAACTDLNAGFAPTAGYTQSQSTLSAFPSTGTQLLWQETSVLLRADDADGEGDRKVDSTFYDVVSDATTYRFRPRLVTKSHRKSGSMLVYAISRSDWDSTLTRLEATKVWFDNNESNAAIEDYEYDPQTGNVTARWKPQQRHDNTTKINFLYDAKKLFAVTETNELGHVVQHVYDYGTGTKLQTDGPNQDSTGVKERQRIKIDGFGRPLESWTTVGTSNYAFHMVGTTTYVDTPTLPTTPVSSTSRQRLDIAGSTWTEQKTELDGLGRTIRSIVYTQGTAPADHVTRYTHNANGSLTSVSVPDPTQNSASVVTYDYTFDSLGRALTIRRPDHATSRSGVDLEYDGRRQIAREVVGAAGGQVGESRSLADFYGRTIEREEKSAASSFQKTTYEYGPDDNVVKVTDPQGGVVTMKHDFAGRRIETERAGSRKWKYVYDRNGNATAEVTPYGVYDPVTEALYTTLVTYDDLDRPKSKLIAKRTLSLADQQLFGTSEKFTYDTGANTIGRLRYWATWGPQTNDIMGANLLYDAHGNVATNNRSAVMAGYNLSRQLYRTFNVAGGVVNTRYRDYIGGSNEIRTNTHYDARGLPSRIVTESSPILTIGEQTRNVAGLVTKRRTNLSGPMTFVESNWTYDTLGRVADQTVQGSLGQVARQTLTYFGNDDIHSLQHSLGATSRLFTYQYDHRHQIKQVDTNTASYFGGSYTYSAAGRLMSADQTRTIAPVPDGADPRLVRNVNYVYGGTDPEQVSALTNASDGSAYASYTYDQAGNQLTRTYPDTNEVFEYLYDGKDQLRRVTRRISGTVTGSEEYWYDEGGRRNHVVKRDASGVKTEMIWFFGDVQAHYDGAGTITRIYSHLSLGTPVARYERTSNTTTRLEFQFHGLANHTLAAVAQSGVTNASFSYSPFGELLEASNGGGVAEGTGAHKRRFNDKYEDDASALTYYGARYYDKVLLGWTQADPVYLRAPDLGTHSTPRRSQVFMFSLNNPARYIDPDGLDVRSAHAGNLSSYRSEKEQSDSYRWHLLADENWMAQRIQPLFSGYGTLNMLWDPKADPCNGVTSVCGGNEDSGGADEEGPFRNFKCYGDECAPLATAWKTTLTLASGGLWRFLPFVLTMSQAKDHNDTVIPIMGFGLGPTNRSPTNKSPVIEGVAKSPVCFVEGTLVKTESGYRPIQNVAKNTYVWSFDQQELRWEKNVVEAVHSRRDRHRLIHVELSDQRVSATPSHPFCVLHGTDLDKRPSIDALSDADLRCNEHGRWVEAVSLRVGDQLMASGSPMRITSLDDSMSDTTVYNLTVRGAHTYAVTSLGLLVHNKPFVAADVWARSYANQVRLEFEAAFRGGARSGGAGRAWNAAGTFIQRIAKTGRAPTADGGYVELLGSIRDELKTVAKEYFQHARSINHKM